MKDIDRLFESCETFCDNVHCNNSHWYDGSFSYGIDFSEINKELKSNGWIIKYEKGQWLDFCCNKCYLEWKEKNK